MLKSTLSGRLDALLLRAFPFLPHLRVHPHCFTALGLGASLVGAALFARGEFRAGAVAIALGGFFDLTDGVLARRQQRSSLVGAFLDSNCDRVVDIALPFALAMHYAQQGALHWAWLAGLVLLLSVLVSYSKAHAERVLPNFHGGWFERAERILVLLAGALFGMMPLALVILAVGCSVTVLQRFAQALRRLAETDAKQGGARHVR